MFFSFSFNNPRISSSFVLSVKSPNFTFFIRYNNESFAFNSYKSLFKSYIDFCYYVAAAAAGVAAAASCAFNSSLSSCMYVSHNSIRFFVLSILSVSVSNFVYLFR